MDTSDTAWRQAILGLSKGGLGLRSLYQHAPAAYIASICSASAVADFNSAVPPDQGTANSLPSLSVSGLPEKLRTLDTCMFNLLLETSSTAD